MTASVGEIASWAGIAQGGSAGNPWNRVQLGEIALPGVCECEGFDREQEVDVKKAQGKDGATLEDKGKTPAKGQIVVKIPSSLWPQWQVILRELDPQKAGAVRQPREIIAPKPNALGVTQIYVQKIELGKPEAGKGMTITLHCIEWCDAPKTAQPSRAVVGAEVIVVQPPPFTIPNPDPTKPPIVIPPPPIPIVVPPHAPDPVEGFDDQTTGEDPTTD